MYKKKKYCHIRAQFSQTNSFLSNNTFCRGAAAADKIYTSHIVSLLFFFSYQPLYTAHELRIIHSHLHIYHFPTINMRPHTKCVGIFIKKRGAFLCARQKRKILEKKMNKTCIYPVVKVQDCSQVRSTILENHTHRNNIN